MEIEELLYQAEGFRCDEKFEEAINLYQKAAELIRADKKFEYKYASKLYRKLCYCYRKQGKINAAIEMGQQSIKSALKTCMKYNQNKESRCALGYCYMNLGVVYDENRQYEKSIEYYQEGINIFKEYIEDDIIVRNAYINAMLSAGTTMYYMERYIEARKIFCDIKDCIGNNTNDSRYNYAVTYLNMIYQNTGEE